MVCNDFKIDISAIKKDIDKIKDNGIQEQIEKKIVKVQNNPYIGEKKRYQLKDYWVVKVKNQKLVIGYKIDEENCIIIFIGIDIHDKFYENTF